MVSIAVAETCNTRAIQIKKAEKNFMKSILVKQCMNIGILLPAQIAAEQLGLFIYLCKMYNIPYFKASGEKEVIDFMHHHPFIILCGIDENNKPVATHVPVLFEERDDKLFLLAHVMRKQEHTNAFANNQNVLAIFYGPHTYVSASWYENKISASTWNYQAVHASGILKFLSGEKLLEVLTKLTEK